MTLIGYVIPSPVIQHFLEDVARHGRFSGVCGLGIRLQVSAACCQLMRVRCELAVYCSDAEPRL